MTLADPDQKTMRPVGWVYLDPGQTWAPGPPCTKCDKEVGPMHTGVRVVAERGGRLICMYCGADAPDRPRQEAGPDGRVQAVAAINGTIRSNPYLTPLATMYGAVEEHDDYDDAWVQAGFTDLGNARRLVQAHGDKFRYVPAWKAFMIYDGWKWVLDEVGAMERYAKNAIQGMIQAAASLSLDSEVQKQLLRHATASCSSGRIQAMIALAGSEPDITMTPDQFDRPLHLLNVRNGVVDLTCGALQDPEPSDYMTRLAGYNYDPDAACPRWNAFIQTLCYGDQDLVDWLQKAVGYSLTGDTSEQCFFFLFGDGANGKSTFLQVLKRLMGSYATTLPFELFLRNTRMNLEHGLATIRGARFGVASEGPEGRSWNEEVIKNITGGEEIRASLKYQNSFEFRPVIKIWFGANDKPLITGATDSMWRRVIPIPCRAHIAPADRDPRLEEHLMAESAGILAWAVRGAERWHQEGLRPLPAAIEEALQEYRGESDVFARYVDERCLVGLDHYQSSSAGLLKDYNAWAKDSNERPMTAQALGRRLARFRGGLLEKGRDNARGYWKRITLIDHHDQEDHGLRAWND